MNTSEENIEWNEDSWKRPKRQQEPSEDLFEGSGEEVPAVLTNNNTTEVQPSEQNVDEESPVVAAAEPIDVPDSAPSETSEDVPPVQAVATADTQDSAPAETNEDVSPVQAVAAADTQDSAPAETSEDVPSVQDVTPVETSDSAPSSETPTQDEETKSRSAFEAGNAVDEVKAKEGDGVIAKSGSEEEDKQRAALGASSTGW